MKQVVTIIALAFVFALATTCSGKNDEGEIEFIDQPAAFTVEGVDHTVASGFSEEDMWADGRIHVELYPVAPSGDLNPWDWDAYPTDTPFVMFSAPAQVGLYDLYLDMNDWSNSQAVTLVEDDNGVPMNWILTDGAVEIISIDATAGVVEGRIAARDTNGNLVNGTFSVPIAPVAK